MLLVTNIAYIVLEGGFSFYKQGKFWLLFSCWAVILATLVYGNF